MKQIFVPQAVVIDFDRTLGNVDAAVERLYNAAELCDIDVNHIREERIRFENDGGSFDPLQYIQSQLDQKSLEHFFEVYTAFEMPEIMYPDARDFLKKLDDTEIYYIVLTYGTNPTWQLLKVRTSGYTGPVSVVHQTDKGKAIIEHREESGVYRFIDSTNNIEFIANTVCLIDDKEIAFKTLPSDCTGFLIHRDGTKLKNPQAVLPEHITTISTLDLLYVDHGIVISD